MLFNSLSYAIFLPIVFLAYWLLPHKYRWTLLLIASYYFYMSWNPKYVVLILLTTAVSYFAAILIEKAETTKVKNAVLAISSVICLGVLFVFKYFNFFSSTVSAVLTAVAVPLSPITLKLLLPVGISFYTFQTMSYVIDVYRGDIEAEHHFGVYATFVSFFPQLVAGPIERTSNLMPQIKAEHTFDYSSSVYGLTMILWGLFKKIAIADVLARYVDAVYASLWEATGFDLLMVIFFFTIQIYCDFSGYSDIAIGSAKLLGINLMTNFKSPYFSVSIKEFWSRWHISLSTWFRDYVYIPLGGNRCSKLKRDRNLLVTFLVSGLWHGANWTFVIWGGLHGIAQIFENRFFRLRDKKTRTELFIRWILVFAFCNLAWVFFRAQSFNEAIFVFRSLLVSLKTPALFFATSTEISKVKLLFIFGAILILAVYDFFSLKIDVIQWVYKQKRFIRWGLFLLLVWYIIFSIQRVGTSEFVYFQF